MAVIVNDVSKCMQNVMNFSEIFMDIEMLGSNLPETPSCWSFISKESLYKCSIAHKLSLLSSQLIFIPTSGSMTALSYCKMVEFGFSIIGIPIEFLRTCDREITIYNQRDERSGTRKQGLFTTAFLIFQHGILFPLFRPFRSSTENTLLKEKIHAQNVEREIASQKPEWVPLFESLDKINGGRTKKEELVESQKKIAKTETAVTEYNAIETILQLPQNIYFFDQPSSYQQFTSELIETHTKRLLSLPTEQHACVHSDPLDLASLPEIPDKLGKRDSFFSNNTCFINKKPLRFPMREKGTPMDMNVCYEREVILAKINSKEGYTSTITGRRLKVEDLEIATKLQEAIEARLQIYQEDLDSFIEAAVTFRSNSSPILPPPSSSSSLSSATSLSLVLPPPPYSPAIPSAPPAEPVVNSTQKSL